MMSTRTGVRALVMVTLCYGALEIVGLLLLLLVVVCSENVVERYVHKKFGVVGRGSRMSYDTIR